MRRLAWALPPAAALLVATGPALPALFTAAILAGAVVLVAARRPGAALVALVVVLPFGPPTWAWLYAHGAPRAVVRGLGGLKEALAIGVAVAAVRTLRERGGRLDALDRLVLAYVGAVTVHLLVPGIVASGNAPVLPFGQRLLGWRENAAFALVFLAARHAPVAAAWRHRLLAVVVWTGAAVAAVGVYQYLRPDAWRDFVVGTLGYPRYLSEVLVSPGVLQGFFDWMAIRPPRAGSVLFSAFSLGDYLLLPLAVGLEGALGGTRPRRLGLTALAAAGIVVSFTRAAMVGAVVCAIAALRPSTGRRAARRVRLGLALVAVAVLAAPGLGDTRITGKHGGARSSTEHVAEVRRGLAALVRHPLGSGLGTGAGTGTRLGAAGSLIADNTLVGVGNELGVVTMALFGATMAVAFLRLRAARASPVGRAAWGAMVALGVSGMFHHVFTDYAVAWTFWVVAGVALGSVALSGRAPARAPAGSPQPSGAT